MKPDLDLCVIERVEANLDGVTGQRRGSFVETVVQQESRVTAHDAIEAMEEEAAQIGSRRELADVFDIALPAQQRSGPESAVFGAVIDAFDPGPETVV